MAILPSYLRGGNREIYDAIEMLSKQLLQLAQASGTPLVPAFVQFNFTDPNDVRPNANCVLWIGPSEPVNALAIDLYVQSS